MKSSYQCSRESLLLRLKQIYAICMHTFIDNLPIIPAFKENGIGILLMNSFALSGFIFTCLISTFPKLQVNIQNSCIRLTS